MNTFTAKLRSDKRKNPELRTYRRLTFEEVKASNGKHILCLDRHGDVAKVHVTSIKTWKTRPEIEVHYQFGLYEHYTERLYPASPAHPVESIHDFVVEVETVGNDIAIGYATTKNFS